MGKWGEGALVGLGGIGGGLLAVLVLMMGCRGSRMLMVLVHL